MPTDSGGNRGVILSGSTTTTPLKPVTVSSNAFAGCVLGVEAVNTYVPSSFTVQNNNMKVQLGVRIYNAGARTDRIQTSARAGSMLERLSAAPFCAAPWQAGLRTARRPCLSPVANH